MRLRVLPLLLVFASATAFAQRPNIDVPATPSRAQPATVSSFAPAQGPVGTQVTIVGANFIPQIKVVVGGRTIGQAQITTTKITFAIPANYFDGVIVLRQPGVANDIMVGRFVVVAPPSIQNVAPLLGPVGTRVEITGLFQPGDQATLNGKVLAPIEAGPGRIIVIVPADARTDFFVVQRPGGTFAKAKKAFVVTLPAPVFADFEPKSGPPGVTVRITGQSFAPEDEVFYGLQKLAVTVRTATTLDATIPPAASKDDILSVRGTRGAVTAARAFELILPPVLASFKPPFGPPGARVEILGDFFRPADSVLLGSRPIPVAGIERNRILVDIPSDARSDVFQIQRAGQILATSRRPFEVVLAPSIAGFSPAGGSPGTRVTITGQNFSPDARVFYGALPLRAAGRAGATGIDVLIPAGAASLPFTVRTRGGEATTPAAFQIYLYSLIDSVSPLSGPIGTRVTITGRNFGSTDNFFLGALQLPIVERQQNAYVVQIPAGAVGGALEWESYGRRTASAFTFEVLIPPTISGFTPGSGPPGTAVTIAGERFGRDVAVFFGTLPCAVTSRAPGQLVIEIPAAAVGSDVLTIESLFLGRIATAQRFTVIPPAILTGISPASGPAGTQVTISGQNLSDVAAAFVGPNPASIVSRQLPNSVVIVIPAAPAGPGRRGRELPIELADSAGKRLRAPLPFRYIIPPTVASFTPAAGAAGTLVTIRGTSFSPGVVVTLRDVPAGITTRSATELVVAVPALPRGIYPFVLDEQGVKVQSATGFEVLEATFDPAAAGTPCASVPHFPGEKEPVIAGGWDCSIGDGTRHHEHAHTHPHQAGDDHHHAHQHPHINVNGHHHGPDAMVAPTFLGFSPESGLPGTLVEIRGERVTVNTLVSFGVLPCAVKSSGVDLVVVEVPAGAVGSDYFSIENKGFARVRALRPFTVNPLPQIAAVAPLLGPVGTQVTISGRFFSPAALVNFGVVSAPILSRSATSLVVTIPAGGRPQDFLSVIDQGQTIRALQPFVVVTLPTVTGFQPASGPAATLVSIKGTFSPTVTVTLRDLPVEIKRRSPTEIVVAVPALPKGLYPFVLVEQGFRVQAATSFEVVEGSPDPAAAGTPCAGVLHFPGEKEPVIVGGWDCSVGVGATHHEHAHNHPHVLTGNCPPGGCNATHADHHHPHGHPHPTPAKHHHPY